MTPCCERLTTWTSRTCGPMSPGRKPRSMIPMPPSSAMTIAIGARVTVSMLADTTGRLIVSRRRQAGAQVNRGGVAALDQAELRRQQDVVERTAVNELAKCHGALMITGAHALAMMSKDLSPPRPTGLQRMQARRAGSCVWRGPPFSASAIRPGIAAAARSGSAAGCPPGSLSFRSARVPRRSSRWLPGRRSRARGWQPAAAAPVSAAPPARATSACSRASCRTRCRSGNEASGCIRR